LIIEITKCATDKCPVRAHCWRYVMPAAPHQSYANFYEQWEMSAAESCPYYIPSPSEDPPLKNSPEEEDSALIRAAHIGHWRKQRGCGGTGGAG